MAGAKKLTELATTGGKAVQLGKPQKEQNELYDASLKKLNLFKKKSDEKFSAKKIIQELHVPYYKKHYNEEELELLGFYYRDVADKLATTKDKGKLKVLANKFKNTSAGQKYANLKEEEIKLTKTSLERILSLIHI